MAAMAFLRSNLIIPSGMSIRSSGRGSNAKRKIIVAPYFSMSFFAVSSWFPYLSFSTRLPPLPMRYALNSPTVDPSPQTKPSNNGLRVAPNA